MYARGKHLFVALDNGRVLRSHLGMYGTWHRYAPGEAWRKPRGRASVELATADEVFVCFNAKDTDCVVARSARTGVALNRVGPDLVARTEPDWAAIVGRARDLVEPAAPLADVEAMRPLARLVQADVHGAAAAEATPSSRRRRTTP